MVPTAGKQYVDARGLDVLFRLLGSGQAKPRSRGEHRLQENQVGDVEMADRHSLLLRLLQDIPQDVHMRSFSA